MNPIMYRIRWSLRRLAVFAVGDRKDLLAMHWLAPLSTRYLPWSMTAMRPSGLAATLGDVVVADRQRIVELGGGVSTFYFGRLLRQKGGHLWTVEHDEHWARLLDREVKAEGLDDVVTVVHAPLAPTSHPYGAVGGTAARQRGRALWYAEDRLRELTAEVTAAGGAQLLLVDGPVAQPDVHVRYPALPFFAGALAPGATVVLDDIDRRGEQEILQRWERETGIRFQRRFIHGNIGVGRTGGPAQSRPAPPSLAS